MRSEQHAERGGTGAALCVALLSPQPSPCSDSKDNAPILPGKGPLPLRPLFISSFPNLPALWQLQTPLDGSESVHSFLLFSMSSDGLFLLAACGEEEKHTRDSRTLPALPK